MSDHDNRTVTDTNGAARTRKPATRTAEPRPGLLALQASVGNAALVEMLRRRGRPGAPVQRRLGGGGGGQQYVQRATKAPHEVYADLTFTASLLDDRGMTRPDIFDSPRREAAEERPGEATRPPTPPTHTGSERAESVAIEVAHESLLSGGGGAGVSYSEKPSTWGDQRVRRSGEGADGVFFVGPPGRDVVVKPLWSTGNVQYADRLLREMGVSVARTARYSLNSRDGSAIRDLLIRNASAGRTATEISDQLTRSQAFLVMERLHGSSLQTMSDDEAMQYITDRASLRQTGRVMAADAFLGNEDRLVGPKVNLGNFLYQVASDVAPGVVHAIDNESRFAAPNVSLNRVGQKKLDTKLQSKVTYINELRAPADRNYFIGRFLDRLVQAHRDNPQVTAALRNPGQRAAVAETIAQGIAWGFDDLANLFASQPDLLRAVGRGYDGASAEARNVSGAKAAAAYVKDARRGMDQAQATDRLVAYVEQRVKKDSKPTLFQRIIRLARS